MEQEPRQDASTKALDRTSPEPESEKLTFAGPRIGQGGAEVDRDCDDDQLEALVTQMLPRNPLSEAVHDCKTAVQAVLARIRG
jgi:hypothetical protein